MNVLRRQNNDDPDTTMQMLEAADTTQQLHDLIKYLRKEKSIVECKFDVLKEEDDRKKLEVDYLSKELQDTRQKLSTEQQKHTEMLNLTKNHDELLKEINAMNVLREENAVLQSDCGILQFRMAEMQSEQETLQNKIQPLEVELSEQKAENEVLLQRISQLDEDNERWKLRSEEILTKYERIDPNEFKELQNQVDSLKSSKAEEQELIQSLQDQVKKVKESKERIVAQSKEVVKKLREQLKEAEDQTQSKESELAVANEELEKLKNESNDQVEEHSSEEILKLQNDKENLVQQLEETTSLKESLHQQLETIRKEVEQLQLELNEAKATISSHTDASNDSSISQDEDLQAIITQKSSEIDELTKSNELLTKEIASLKDSAAQQPSQPEASQNTISEDAERYKILNSRYEDLRGRYLELRAQDANIVKESETLKAKMEEMSKQIETSETNNENYVNITRQLETKTTELENLKRQGSGANSAENNDEQAKAKRIEELKHARESGKREEAMRSSLKIKKLSDQVLLLQKQLSESDGKSSSTKVVPDSSTNAPIEAPSSIPQPTSKGRGTSAFKTGLQASMHSQIPRPSNLPQLSKPVKRAMSATPGEENTMATKRTHEQSEEQNETGDSDKKAKLDDSKSVQDDDGNVASTD